VRFTMMTRKSTWYMLIVSTLPLWSLGILTQAQEQIGGIQRHHSILINYIETPVPARRLTGSPRRRPTSYKVSSVKDGGTLSGVVRYEGKLPAPRKIQIVKDVPHCGQRSKEEQLVKADDKGRVAEAIVFLGNITEGRDFPKRDKPPLIDQRLCTFNPHIQAVRAKEPVEILNSDPVGHNINASQRIFTLFNILQPQKDMRATQQFDKPGLVEIKCNVHDWMHGYLYVFVHPYYQVTGADGSFKIDQIPPGKYELVIWQEYLGEQAMEIEIKSGQTTELNVLLEPKDGEGGGQKT
jgi:plastocyanin